MNINTKDAPVFERAGLLKYLQTCMVDDVVPMVWGPPGIGKSQLMEMLADMLGFKLVHVHCGQYAIHSASGIVIPNTADKTSYFTEPDFYTKAKEHEANGDKVLIFFDEMPNAPKDVAAVFLQAVDEHRIGMHEFTDNMHIMCAGNRPEDGAHACNMPATLANRIAHCVFEGATVSEFCEFGEATGRVSPVFMAHLQSNPQHLHDFDKTRAINATHRTWEMASRMMDRCIAEGGSILDPDFISHLSTRIPRSIVVDMAVSFALHGKTTPIAEVIANPESALIPSEREDMDASDQLPASYMQMRICNAHLEDNKSEAQAIATYIGRMSSELKAAFAAMVMRRYNEKLVTSSVLQVFSQAFKHEFIAVIEKAATR